MNKTPLWKTLGGLAVVAIATVALLLVNLLASRVGSLRADLTEGGLYSLAKGTRQVLKELPRDVTLKFYVSRTSAEMPPEQKQYADRVQDLLRELESAGKGKVHLEIINVRPDSDEEDWAVKYGLVGRIPNPLKPDQYFCGVVVLSGAEERALAFLEAQGEQRLEYELVRTILDASRTEKPRLGVISGLPVFGMPGGPAMMMQRQRPMPKWVAIQALESFFQVEQLGPSVTRIPDEIKCVLLIHPKDLSPETLYVLDQFVLRGGRLVAFTDPYCMEEASAARANPMMMGMDSASSLNALTRAWGVEMAEGQVAGDARLATLLRVSQDRGGYVPVALTLQQENLSAENVATADLGQVMQILAGRFTATNKVQGVEVSDLLFTTDQGGTVGAMEAMGDPATLERRLKPQGKMLTGVKLSGRFPTAFPGGRPGTNTTDNASAHLAKGERDSAVVLIGDVDMLADNWMVSLRNVGGAVMAQPFNGNMSLLVNLVEQMGGNDALIGLRSRGAFGRPFTRMAEIRQKASDQYEEELQKTQDKITEVNARIAELSQGRRGADRVALDNSIAAEIQKGMKEVQDLRKKSRELEKQLRRDEEALEFRIKAANIVAVPLLVAIFGLARGVIRKTRSGKPS